MVPTSIAVAVLFSTAPLADALLTRHLAGWEKMTASSTTYSAQFEQVQTQAPFNKKTTYRGSVAFRKPDLMRMSSQNAEDQQDYAVQLFNGQSSFIYDWRWKQVWEFPLVKNGNSREFVHFFGSKARLLDLELFELIHNFKVADATKRYRFQLVNPLDANYAYLNLKPVAAPDAAVQEIQIVLYGPKVSKPYTPYLPAEVRIKHPNGDTRHWRFSMQQLGVELDRKAFEHETPPGWKYNKLSTPEERKKEGR